MEELLKHILSLEVTTASAALKLGISFLLGAVIGIERQSRRQSAGLRTFAIICMASTTATLLSVWIPHYFLQASNYNLKFCLLYYIQKYKTVLYYLILQ